MIRIRQVNIEINAEEKEIIKQCSKKLKINENKIKEYNIVKKSIDARDKENIVFSYEVDVKVENEDELLKKNKSKDTGCTTLERTICKKYYYKFKK